MGIRESNIYQEPDQRPPQVARKPLPAGGRPKPPPRPSLAKPRARILYDYDRTEMTEIDIREGEIVTLTNTDDLLNGWYEGLKADGKTRGYFPASYCQKI